MCVRRNAQLRELKLLEFTRFVLNTVVVITVSTDGPTGCLVYPPLLSPQKIQLHEKSPAGRGACCGTAHRLLLATADPIATIPGAGIGLAQIIVNQRETRKRRGIHARVLDGGGQAVEMGCRQDAPFRH